jgi:hypothetical protein
LIPVAADTLTKREASLLSVNDRERFVQDDGRAMFSPTELLKECLGGATAGPHALRRPHLGRRDRMQPRKRWETGEQDLFRSRLDQIIDLKHPLVALGRMVDLGVPGTGVWGGLHG